MGLYRDKAFWRGLRWIGGLGDQLHRWRGWLAASHSAVAGDVRLLRCLLEGRLGPLNRHQSLFRLLEFLRPFGDGLRLAGGLNVAEPHGFGAKN